MKSILLVILIIVGLIVGWGLFNFLLVSSGFALADLEEQFPILQPLLGVILIALLLILLFISYQKTSIRAKQVLSETGLAKLASLYLSFRWGQIFLVDLVILLTIVLLLITNR
jgi:hypothetical protein